MSNSIVGCHKLKHLLDLFVIFHLTAVQSDPESFRSSPFKNWLVVREFSFLWIAAQVDSHDDLIKLLT